MTALPDEEFAKPSAPGAGIKYEAHLGALVMVKPYTVETDVQTTYGPKEAVRADVDVISGPGVGVVYKDTLIFGAVLPGQLRDHLGGRVLGRLAQGTAKPGQKPPWLLEEATGDDIEKAKAYLSAQRQPSSAGSTDAPPF